MTEAGCHEPTQCAGSFVTAQSTMHWRHESRRPDESDDRQARPDVIIVDRSFPYRAKGRKIEGAPVAGLSRYACSPSRRNRGDTVLSETSDTPNPRLPSEQNTGTRSNEERPAKEGKRRCVKQRSPAHSESVATYEPGELAVRLTSQIGFVVHNMHSRPNRWGRPSCFRHTPVPGNDSG